MENKEFIIHWLDGTSESMHGSSISDAFMKAGYGGGATAAIDGWEEVNDQPKENSSEE